MRDEAQSELWEFQILETRPNVYPPRRPGEQCSCPSHHPQKLSKWTAITRFIDFNVILTLGGGTQSTRYTSQKPNLAVSKILLNI